jgi:hypothetical protein
MGTFNSRGIHSHVTIVIEESQSVTAISLPSHAHCCRSGIYVVSMNACNDQMGFLVNKTGTFHREFDDGPSH